MLILGIDSSASTVSSAICEIPFIGKNTEVSYETFLRQSKVIAEGKINNKQMHSKTLMPLIEQLLKGAELNVSDIDAYAVSIGPGSFTGLRIGLSIIKGMDFVGQKPCIAVSTLHALATNLIGRSCYVCAAMDARCNEIYTADFDVSSSGIERLTDDRRERCSDVLERLDRLPQTVSDIVLVGDGAELLYKANTSKRIKLPSPFLIYQNAVSVCLSSYFYDTDTAEALAPAYLRIPQAERERKEKELC